MFLLKKIFSKIKICSILVLFSLGACMSGKSDKADEIFEKEKFEPSAYERAKTYADKNPITLFGKDLRIKILILNLVLQTYYGEHL